MFGFYDLYENYVHSFHTIHSCYTELSQIRTNETRYSCFTVYNISAATPFKFTNENDGFCLLAYRLNSFEQDQRIIGLESTAHYGNNLLMFLVPKGYNVCLINPIQTAQMRKNNIRKTKTDKVDTIIICKVLMMHPHRFVTP